MKKNRKIWKKTMPSHLDKYLIDNCLTTTEFSKISGLSIATIYKILNGGKVNMNTARKIKKATNGAIPVQCIIKS